MSLLFHTGNVLSAILPALLFLGGGWFFLILRGAPLSHPVSSLRSVLRKSGDGISPFRSAVLALAGTLGVGNIAGVATAISMGGPGAVFWMLVSSLFAMFVKYAEVVLAVRFRKDENGKRSGGAAYYIEKGVGSRTLAVIFSVLCILSSLTVGNVVQSYAASDALNHSFGISKAVTGLVLCFVTSLVVFGGLKRITDFTTAVIPFLSGCYILISLVIIAKNVTSLPGVFSMILKDAFSFRSAAAGASGFALVRIFSSPSVRLGTARGLLSNEAGCGTAPTAHASSAESSPARQGLFGVFEVFCDTVVLCTLTALVILVSYDKLDLSLGGTALALSAFGFGLGKAAEYFIAVSTFIYALASIICWSYYGTQSISYLGKENMIKPYVLLFSLTAFAGALAAPDAVWALSDISIALMCILNTSCTLRLSSVVRAETEMYFGRRRRRKKPKTRKKALEKNTVM